MINSPFTIIDLSHDYHPDIPSWNGGCGFKPEIKLDYSQCNAKVKFRVQQFKMHAGIGTHMDAPAHCVENGPTIEQIPLQQLITPCLCIDVSNQCDAHYQVSLTDIQQFEQQHVTIPDNCLVIFYTGWSQFWQTPEQYHNNHQFPSIAAECADYLLTKNIAGIGIDTLSPDTPDSGFPIHQALLGAGKFIIENVAHAEQLPAHGATTIALPFKFKDGTESPTRLIALIRSSEGGLS